MKSQNQGTLKYLRGKFDTKSTSCFILSLVVIVILLTLASVGFLERPTLGWCIAAVTLLLLGSFMRPLLAMAFDGFEAVFSVCATGLILFVVTITSWMICYYLITGQLNSQAPAAKILDIPTLIIALWVAATGWYVHFQLTRRSHRVTHAMSLVLGTRTNSEFQRHNEVSRLRLHSKEVCNALDEKFFLPGALHTYQDAVTDDPNSAEAKQDLETAKCVESLKFLLNYYEFMAVGIKLGDIEESIVYETISPSVVALYDRAEAFITWVRDPAKGKQPLMLEHLQVLVERWRKALKADEFDLVRGE